MQITEDYSEFVDLVGFQFQLDLMGLPAHSFHS
jgi:hypothetical protein